MNFAWKSLKAALWLLLAVFLLAGCSGEDTASGKSREQDNKVYWNVEKYVYSDNDAIRMIRDGKFYVRVMTDGEQVDLPVEDINVVNHMDTLEVMGLQFDEAGVVTDVIPVEDMGYTIVAEDYYVQSYTADSLVCNSMGNGKALSKTFAMNEKTQIYLVDEEGSPLCGMPGMLQEKARVLALEDASGSLSHLYIFEPYKQGNVYWNHARKYDSASKSTTRELDAMARYVYDFTVNGEVVTLYTKDQDIANAIDAVAAKCMGLGFDEDGYINEVYTTQKMTGGKSWGSWFYIMEMDEKVLSGKKFSGSNIGSTTRGEMADDCKVFDVSGKGSYIGEPTELRLYDQVHGLRNEFGEICYLFVVRRLYQSDIYYNVDRQYDSAAKMTKRTPGADGYYHIELSVNGQPVTLKTKDQEIVNSIDAAAARCFGLDVRNGEILEFYAASSVWGGRQFCSYDYITAIAEDGTITAKEADVENKGDKTYIGKMTADCGVYNVSSTATVVGEKTTLRVGDKVHALMNLNGEVTHIFVVTRTYDVPVYWNVNRQYDSQKKATKRIPNAQGYYEIVLAIDGEQKTYKTKDKDLINQIDAVATKCFGLETSGNIITKMYKTSSVKGGAQFCSYDIVTSLRNGVITAKEMDVEKHGAKTYTGKMAKNCKIYNVSNSATVIGEKTTLQVGDKIHALKNHNGEVTYVFVTTRTYQVPIYWNVDRQYDSEKKITNRTPNTEGYYEILLACNGQQKVYKTKSLTLINEIDAVATKCFGLATDGNIITRMYPTTTVKGGLQFCSYDIVTSLKNGVITAKEMDIAKHGERNYVGKMRADCGIYNVSGTAHMIGEKTTLQVGDKIHALKDSDGNVTHVFVLTRTYRAPIYWNVERKYDSATQMTKRTPNAEGYYEILLAIDGQQKIYKTKDVALISKIDGVATQCFGLATNGDVITAMYPTAYVEGGAQFCSYDIVTSLKNGVITAKEMDVEKHGEKNYVGKMRADCGIYNVSNTADVIGEKTTLQVGDKIHALKDSDGNVTHVFVLTRTYRAPIYWNVERKYDSATQMTKRTPNAEGYYEILLAIDGQQKVYKTKNAALISKIDAVATKCFGLATNGDVITAMYPTAYVEGGTQFCSWDFVTSIQGDTVVAEEADGSKTYTGTLSINTKVYDVTGNGAFIGEETTLQVGDKIHALKYTTGDINIIYVVGREEKVVEETGFCQQCQKNVTWYSWDGSATMEHGKHYFLCHDIAISKTAYIGADDQTDVYVTLDLRGNNIHAAVRAFRIYGTFDLLDTQGEGVIYGNASGQATGFYVYDAGTFNMYGGQFVGGESPNSQCGIGALGLNKGSGATFNMYGGSLQNGNTQKDGGNLALYHEAVFNMYGGLIANGQTQTTGGNISAGESGQINLYGGSILGGTAATGNCVYGGKITIYDNAPVLVDDIYLKNPLELPHVLAEGSKITVTLPSGGCATGETPEANLQYIQASGGEILWKDGKLQITRPADRIAFCAHCQQNVDWYIWKGDNTLENGIHYYLNDTVSVSETAYIGSADEKDVAVCLDLNGHSIDATVRVFRVYGNLNLMDSVGTGVITGNTAGQASVFYVYENAVFNFYGGTMTAIKTVTSSSGAGIGGIDKGTMNMYGGTITGGVAQKSGGNLNLYNTGVLNLYGGTIQNGTSLEASGGNIQMSTSSKLHIYGGSILGGSAANLGDCINANGAVTLHGQDKISVTQIYLPGTKKLSIDGVLAEGSSVGIGLENQTGVFTGATQEANLPFFHHDDYMVAFTDGKLSLQAEQPEIPEIPEDPNAHKHCICGELGKVGDHATCTAVEWTPWPGVDQLVLDGSVYYYLEGDVTVDKAIKLEEGQILNLCLNGWSITTDQKIYIFDISGGLNICDHKEQKGAVTNLYAGTSHSMAFYLRGSKTGSWFNMFGGTYSAPNGKTTGTGAAVARVGTTAGMAIFKMYGGCITGGQAASANVAGNLVLEQGSVTYLYGGSITNGNNTKGAGNVIVKNGAQMTIDGGTVTNGVGVNGGNICVKSGCLLAVVSGAVTGGSIYAEGSVTVNDSATVESVETP